MEHCKYIVTLMGMLWSAFCFFPYNNGWKEMGMTFFCSYTLVVLSLSFVVIRWTQSNKQTSYGLQGIIICLDTGFTKEVIVI